MGDSGSRASCRGRALPTTGHFRCFSTWSRPSRPHLLQDQPLCPRKDRWTHPPGVRLVRATSHVRLDPSEVWWVVWYRSGRHSDGRSPACNEERQRRPALSEG